MLSLRTILRTPFARTPGATRSVRRRFIVLFVLMIIGAYRFANSDNNIGAFLAALCFGGANFAVLIGYGIGSHFR